MIIRKMWLQSIKNGGPEWIREGWYLFGFIPLYIQDLAPRGRKYSKG